MNKIRHSLGFALIIVDQIIKALAVRYLKPIESVAALPFVSFTYVENTGISFGLLQQVGNGTLLALNFLLVAGILSYYLLRQKSWGEGLRCWSFLLILAGAIGNLIDRIGRGYVIDFIDFHFFPVFNFADSMITVGGGLYFWGSIRKQSNSHTIP